MTVSQGDRLGAYEILASLGMGGMGEVYRARDTKLQRDVAIKILPEAFASDPGRRERFEREARTVAALNHPNIVTIFSVEAEGGVLFLTMELVEGKPLSELIPKDGMGLAQILKTMIPLADAVSAAHQRGITHRDLKPANVMVAHDGRVKVLDFGLAKLRETDLADATMLPAHALTGEGHIVGTVAYMSPEQAEGKPVDERSDIFSLGIILFEIATGQRPFKGDTSASVLASIIKDTPASVADVKTGVPRDLARIVKRSLVKDPEHRYQTAKDFRNELEALKDALESGDIEAPATSGSHAPAGHRANRAWVGAAAGVALVALAAAAFVVFRGQPQNIAASRAFDAVKLTRLTSTGKATLAAISPDGKYVVHVVADGGLQSLWIRQVATTSNVQIVPPADVRYDGVTFGPDGTYVYYSAYPSVASGGNVAPLYQVPILGGTPRRILDDIDSPVTFAPDGKRFAFMRGFVTEGATAIMIADADGTGAKRLAARKNPDTYPTSNVAWSPDGRLVAVPVIEGSDVQRSMNVVAVDAKSGAETRIGSKRWEFVGSVAWVDRGRGLVLTATEPGGSPQLWYVSYPAGEAHRITNDLNNYDQISVTADSNALVTVQADRQSHLWVAPAGDASRGAEITSGIGRFDGEPVWTPDGKIVYASNASGNPDIWICDGDGRNAKQLTVDPGYDGEPAVSPDGKTVVFVSRRGGLQIWKMDIDGGNQAPLTRAPGMVPVISPDGRWVFYTSVAEAQRSVWKIPVAGGEAVRVFGPHTPPDDDPVRATVRATFVARGISPDGKVLAGSFLDREVRGFRLGLVSLDSAELVKKFDHGPFTSAFTPDGRALTYSEAKNGVWNLWNQPIDGGSPKPVTSFTSGSIFGFAWSGGGKRLVIARGTETSDAVLVSNLTPAAR